MKDSNQPRSAAILPMLIGAALVSSFACSPVFAQNKCQKRLQNITKKYNKVQRVLPQQTRANLNRLHKSAVLLAKSGRQSLCNDVADAMHSIMENHHDAIQKAQRQMRFANAPPVTQIKGVIRASELDGAAVYSKNAKQLGTIKDVVIDPSGRIAYAALSTHGKLIAVPWKSFKYAKKNNALVLGVRPKRLQNLKGFDKDKWPLHANRNLQTQRGKNHG
jgi:hypothetical protein